MICSELEKVDAKELAQQLAVDFNEDEPLKDKLRMVPWPRLKQELELMGKIDLIKRVRETTLIKKGKSVKILSKNREVS